MLDALRRITRAGLSLVGLQAAELPLVPVPKVRPKQQSIPSHITNTRTSGDSALPLNDRRLANTDTLTFRSGSDTRTVIRNLRKVTPDLSAATFAYLRTSITGSFTTVARNTDGTLNREATILAQQVMTRFNVVQDYTDGFSGIWGLRSLSESLALELISYGACAVELVLDKARLPRSLQPVSVTQLQFKADDKWLKPVQRVGSDEIDLDIPTFFYTALDQDLLEPYAESPLEAAIQPVLADLDFFNDLRRLVKRVLHPRLDVQIIEEKFRETIPPEVKADRVKLKEYCDNVISSITQLINDLGPEDALVHFDFIRVEYVNHGQASPAGEEKVLTEINRARLASAGKTLPSILGHGGGTQNVASAEAMLFMKSCAGAVQEKLNDLYSRALTLALRLFGLDVYVEFKYAPIDLRPENELEAFRAMKQSRVLELLSLGFYPDDEASILLTGNITPAGFKPLSGTNFRSPGAAAADAEGNPYSTTGAQGNKQGANNQALKPDTPTKPKSERKQ